MNYLISDRARKSLTFTFFLLLLAGNLQAQTKADSLFLLDVKDTTTFQNVSRLDPNKAAMLSAVLPGLGQIYNGQAWKVPIIYTGAIIIGHYLNYNNRIFSVLRSSQIALADDDPTTISRLPERFPETRLERNQQQFRENRDYMIIFAVAAYLLNIVDAHVSAHLHEFEVNEKLSFNFKPSIQSTPLISQSLGLSISLNLN